MHGGLSLVDALILRALPVRDPESLVYLDGARRHADQPSTPTLSYPLFDRVRQAVAPQMEAFSMSHQSLRQAVLPDAGGVEEKLRTQFVSGNAFQVLGVRAILGRMLAASDDVTPGGHPVAVISHTFWNHRLSGNPAAIGQWLQLEQQAYQIVGVAQAGFTGTQPGALTDIWVPNMMFQRESLSAASWGWLQVWGRLAPTWGLGFNETGDVFGSTANGEHSNYVAIPRRFYSGVKGLTGAPVVVVVLCLPLAARPIRGSWWTLSL